MCKICVLAARYPRRQDSLGFNLGQFAVAIEVQPLLEPSPDRLPKSKRNLLQTQGGDQAV